MPRHTETSANAAVGRLLARMLPTYDVRSENTQQIVGNPGLQPDILITAPGRASVVIEAEFMPAYTAEQEAKDRSRSYLQKIDATTMLQYPDGMADVDDLHQSSRLCPS